MPTYKPTPLHSGVSPTVNNLNVHYSRLLINNREKREVTELMSQAFQLQRRHQSDPVFHVLSRMKTRKDV